MPDEMTREQFFEEVIRDWTECNAVCDLAVPRKKFKEGLEKADRYMEILPGADYVLTQTLNYIFSNGLTTGSIKQDEVLDKFLYSINDKGTTNLHELRNALGMAITHGTSGLRWKDGNVYQYKWGTYRALTYLQGGIRKVVGYLVAKDGGYVPTPRFNPKDYTEYQDFLKEIDEEELMVLSPSEFLNIRNDTSEIYGHSPLLADQERLDLLVAVYERLNYDINYDGPGRIIIRPKDGFLQGDETDISATQVMSESLKANKDRVDDLKKEATRVANQIKKSSSDSVVVLSNAFDKEIEKLPRVTKATEFFDWLKNDTMILAQDFGMNPSLMELGNVSGNVSMTSILDTAILNSIVPLRERYAVQFSGFLSNHLRIEKVYFNLYDLQQREDENTMRTKIVNMMSLLNAMRVKEGENEVLQPMAQSLFDSLAEMLDENLHNELNQLEEL